MSQLCSWYSAPAPGRNIKCFGQHVDLASFFNLPTPLELKAKKTKKTLGDCELYMMEEQMLWPDTGSGDGSMGDDEEELFRNYHDDYSIGSNEWHPMQYEDIRILFCSTPKCIQLLLYSYGQNESRCTLSSQFVSTPTFSAPSSLGVAPRIQPSSV